MNWPPSLVALGALCTACSAATAEKVPPAKSHPVKALQNGVSEQVFDGPGVVCAEAFAIVLNDGERLTSRDPGLDFMTYAVKGPGGDFLLYAGNAPQRHDDEIQTGLSFLSMIAIHDHRTDAQKQAGPIRNRLIVRPRFYNFCPKAD